MLQTARRNFAGVTTIVGTEHFTYTRDIMDTLLHPVRDWNYDFKDYDFKSNLEKLAVASFCVVGYGFGAMIMLPLCLALDVIREPLVLYNSLKRQAST